LIALNVRVSETSRAIKSVSDKVRTLHLPKRKNIMKKYFVFLFLFACTETKTTSLLSPVDFDTQYRATEGAILLDVRTVEEVNAGALAGAINIVYDDAFAEKLSHLEKKPIFVYCGSGIRSAKGAAILKEKGYNSVFEMDGGMKAWKAAGLPVQ